MRRTLGAEELSRDVEGLAADDDNLLAIEELLGHGRGETTEKVSLAVNNNLYTAVLVHVSSSSISSPMHFLAAGSAAHTIVLHLALSGIADVPPVRRSTCWRIDRWVKCVVDLKLLVKSKIVRIGEVGAKSRLS